MGGRKNKYNVPIVKMKEGLIVQEQMYVFRDHWGKQANYKKRRGEIKRHTKPRSQVGGGPGVRHNVVRYGRQG